MEYTIKRKNVKNFRITIKPTREVIVTAPLYASDKIIDEFFNKNILWVKKNIDKAYDDTLNDDIYEGSIIYILGRPYSVRLILNNKDYVLLEDGFLSIYLKEIETKRIYRTYNKFLNELRINTYKEILSKYLNLTGLSIESLKIKNMTRTNGKCYYLKKEIILSSSIIHKSYDFIEAVILHEIAHLKYPNHQKEFYDFISLYMKDYKTKIKKYKEVE